jgi:signal transduction histidine kinase/ligand-binding sensor domain-containing protein
LLPLFVPAARALDMSKSLTQYAHRSWGQEEGLFQPTIYSILQTRDGFLWLGTQDSLIRFDGIRFHEFDEGNSLLHGRLVRALAEDSRGNLWAGSLGGGAVRIAANGVLQQYTKQNGLGSDSVFCLVSTHDDSMWACTNEGLSQIGKNGIRTYTTRDGLPSNRVRAACEASDGDLWIAGLDFGLSRWDGSHFHLVDVPEIGSRQSVTALACAHDSSLWIGTSRGLVHISGLSTQRYPAIGTSPDDEVSALLEARDGSLWIGTSDGIVRLRKGEFSRYRTRDGLSHSQVLALWLDREGALWSGTKNGLDQFADGKAAPFTTNEGLSSNDSGPVLEDREGRIWVGTLDRGLNVIQGERIQKITQRNGLLSDRVLSLALGRADDIWVGTSAGVNRIVKGRVVAAYDMRSGISGEIRSLFVDESGAVWAADGDEVLRLDGNRFVSVNALRQATASIPHAIPLFEGSDNPGLLGLAAGRAMFSELEITHPVESIFFDKRTDSLWLGTLGSGLLRLRGSSVAHIYAKDGLFDTRIYGILPDSRGDLWLASSKGIFRLSQSELNDFADGKRTSVQSYPFSTGQLHFECKAGVQPAACRARDGRLWFSTSSGLIVIDPNRISGNPVAPPAAITALVANGRRIDGSLSPRLQANEANNLEIRYAGLSFINPEKVTFRYRLSGYERNWVDAGVRREAFYTNLPPGDFDFEVQAQNADGIWSTSPAALRFTIEPRWYQHRWFLPLIALSLGLAVLATVRLRLRQMRTRFALVLGERTRIARELHDTLLQGLSGITMQLQALAIRLPNGDEKRLLSEIIRDASRAASEARQSLWGLRGGSAPDFSERLTELVGQVMRDRHIAVSLSVAPISLAGLPDCEFQLLRIAREALTNTLKHAGALRVGVVLTRDRGGLRMTIEDDGLGFDSSLETPLHFGMRGMQERAQEIGAELEVISSPQGGTRIVVFLPLAEKLTTTGNHSGAETHQL